MPLSVRAALPGDLPAILALEQGEPAAAHWTAEQYQGRLSDGGVILAEQDGKTRGFLCVRVVAGEWEIENVVVDGACRRHGLGTALMQRLLRNWEAAHASVLLLEVRESNESAQAFYEKFGLREAGRRRAYYSNPGEDAILYARYREV